MLIDLSEIAIYLDPAVINRQIGHSEQSYFQIYCVAQGTLHLKTEQYTLDIKNNYLLKLYRTDEPILVYGSGNCVVGYDSHEDFIDYLHQRLNSLNEVNDRIYLKDSYTSTHCRRVRNLVFRISLILNLHPTEIYNLRLAALYHDLGKIDVPVEILLKKGKLSSDEFSEIQKHPVKGAELMRHCNISNSEYISRIILQHHEKLDGSGYPNNLKGDEILKEARILAVADAFDALITERPYKKSLSHEEAISILRSEQRQLDQQVVSILETLSKEDSVFNRDDSYSQVPEVFLQY